MRGKSVGLTFHQSGIPISWRRHPPYAILADHAIESLTTYNTSSRSVDGARGIQRRTARCCDCCLSTHHMDICPPSRLCSHPHHEIVPSRRLAHACFPSMLPQCHTRPRKIEGTNTENSLCSLSFVASSLLDYTMASEGMILPYYTTERWRPER